MVEKLAAIAESEIAGSRNEVISNSNIEDKSK